MTPRQQPAHNTSPHKVVLGTISSDSHTWNLLFLQLLLEEHGCAVTNLGACTPAEELIAEAAELRPDLIVISTVNGLGVQEAPELARAVRATPSLREVPLVIGGKLDTLGSSGDGDFPALAAAGFDAVLVGADALTHMLALLDRPATADPDEHSRTEYADARN